MSDRACSWRSRAACLVLMVLVALVSGCSPSSAAPKAPKVRVEGPTGTRLGYTVSYFDGPGNLDVNATAKVIPAWGVCTEDLNGTHQGVMVQVLPNSSASVTVILFDGAKELQRASAKGPEETATVMAGKVDLTGPLKP